MRRHFRFGSFILPFVGLVMACSGKDSGTTKGEIVFHGEQNPLGDYSYDTGLQPPGSPVQVGFAFASKATLSVDAKAIATDDQALVGEPGTGKLALDASFSLKGSLKVDVTGIPPYNGDIPGLDAIDVHLSGDQAFDPFATDAPVDLTVNLPETKLPDIPLPGGIPGTLQMTVTTASTLTSSFRGTCVANDGKQASYRGTSTTHGSIVIHPTIVISIPIVGDKTFDLPDVTAPVPNLTADIDLGTKTISDTGDAPVSGKKIKQASCSSDGSGGAGGAGSGSTGGAGGAGTGGMGGMGGSGASASQVSSSSGGSCAHSTDCGQNQACVLGACSTPDPVVSITVPSGVASVNKLDSFACSIGNAFGQCLSLQLGAPGIDSTSDLQLNAQNVGTFCEAPQNVAYDEIVGNTLTAQCESDGSAPCGFQVDELPINGTGRYRGHYTGTLLGFGPYFGDDRQLTVVFDVPPQAGSF